MLDAIIAVTLELGEVEVRCKRVEVKEICAALGIDQSGKELAGLVGRIMGAQGNKAAPLNTELRTVLAIQTRSLASVWLPQRAMSH